MIQERAMLAQLSISQWTARKHDKSVSAEVEKAHSAHNAGRFNKDLVDKALLEPISKLAGQVRDFHYDKTLAWNDSGARLLPSVLFADYSAKIRFFRREFDKLVGEMVTQYPIEVQAARNRLGTMYNPGDYPDPQEIRDRFQIKVEFEPVPSANDFRVNVAKEAADEIRSSITQSVLDRQADAVKSTYKRIHDVVSKVYERLSIEDAIFKDTLIKNVQDLCVVLPAFNLNNDPAITKLHTALMDLTDVRIQDLRVNPRLRRSTADKAQAILNTL